MLKDLPKKKKADLERVIFFAGSFFYTARPIPGLEFAKLPLEILAGETSDGDSFSIQRVFHYKAPSILTTPVALVAGKNEVILDNRCQDCVKAFHDVRGILQHCQETGHSPAFDPDESGLGAKEADPPVFVSYVNMVLSRALGERMARWGKEFVDPAKSTEPKDRNGNSLGVTIYEAYSCDFGMVRPKTNNPSKAHLALTVDLRAKVLRTASVLEQLYQGDNPNTYKFTHKDIDQAKRAWVGTTVIYKADKKCYSIVALHFDHSANSLPVEGLKINNKAVSHAEYFEKRKNIVLKYPNACPIIECLGRRKNTIFLPAELVCGDELAQDVKVMLPTIASYTPEKRNLAIEEIKNYLKPGAQTTKSASGLLPACGIVLSEDRLQAKATVLPVPVLLAAGVKVPSRNAENWAPVLTRANFNIDSCKAVKLNVVVFHSKKLRNGTREVFNTIKNLVNGFQASYVFSESVELVETEENERHWGAVERYFSGKPKENLFVLDFTKPRGTLDLAYPVIKMLLTKAGHLSQFVNFNTYPHDNARNPKKSNTILQGVARQILQKCGVRLWWTTLPKSIPLPAVFVGVDVFHAPRVYDPIKKMRVARASCAAIIIEIIRPDSHKKHKVEIYSETFARSAGEEYGLKDALRSALANALKFCKVNPMCAIIWRDGIGDSAFDTLAGEEITGIRSGLLGGATVGAELTQPASDIPIAYIVCQKRIATKFVTRALPGIPDGKYGAPPGTLVEGIQGLKYDTFYIQGRAPPTSTPKPVRFIVVQKDDKLKQLPLPELTWACCHTYANWPGPIKSPSVAMMAHKLAELGGMMPNCGKEIDHVSFANKVHFL